MTMKKTAALASALRNTGARVSAVQTPPVSDQITPTPEAATARRQVSRLGTKPITVHHPEEVRRQLKALAGEQGRAVEDMVAEAFNLLFAKYRKPEIAPVKARQVI
jgi:hypothetical protein